MLFSLRASVSNLCNMDCVYCPRWSSMEDFSPQGLSAKGLSPADYLKVFTTLVQSMNFSSVSITGGEPLINKGLIDIIKSIRPHVKQLEITTNGTMLTHARWQELSPYFDRVKISMDSIEPNEFQRMTGLKLADGLDKVQNAIKMVRDGGVDIAVNCVVMNSNLGEITGVIDWAKEQRVRLHLLDFYHTEERHDVWEREFVPFEIIIPGLIQRYGEPEEEDRFGCKFLTFNFEEKPSVLRLKTTFSGTMRADKCTNCSEYCQEGLYGIKLSQKGWVTSCPSNDKEKGVQLSPEFDIDQTKQVLSGLVEDIDSAVLVPNSFEIFIERNHLKFQV